MFFHLSCHSVHRGDVCLSACWDTPTPWADTPRQTPLPGQTPPPQMATAVDGTHPTGMHSCKI